jgi:hypothetical protein
LDAKFQTAPVEEVKMDDVLQSLKIRTGKVSDADWVTLSIKIWRKMTNTERQSFVSKMENNPKTIRDFYAVLIDCFLENLNCQNIVTSTSFDAETKLAVNFNA